MAGKNAGRDLVSLVPAPSGGAGTQAWQVLAITWAQMISLKNYEDRYLAGVRRPSTIHGMRLAALGPLALYR